MTDEKRQRRRRAAVRRRAPEGIDDGDAIDDRDPRLPARRARSRELDEGRRLRLFTATNALPFERRVMFVFHASIARSAREVRSVLRLRFGEAGAATARISEGFDERDFIARTVVAPTLRDLLREVEEHPEGIEADGFDVTHMQTVGIEPPF